MRPLQYPFSVFGITMSPLHDGDIGLRRDFVLKRSAIAQGYDRTNEAHTEGRAHTKDARLSYLSNS